MNERIKKTHHVRLLVRLLSSVHDQSTQGHGFIVLGVDHLGDTDGSRNAHD